MRQKLLLGFTKNKEVIFGEVEYRNGQFTASFDTSYPMEITKELTMERIEDLIEQTDKDWVLDKLENYDCKPSELAERLYLDTYNDIEEYWDNSLYPESFRIDGVTDDIYFLASGCGQQDTRDEMSIYINKELYDAIHKLWDEHHLKDIPFEEVKEVFDAIDHQNNTIDDYKVVENWLINNFK